MAGNFIVFHCELCLKSILEVTISSIEFAGAAMLMT
jgi:hypothetical protein